MALVDLDRSRAQPEQARQRPWTLALTVAVAGAILIALMGLLWFGLAQREKGTVGVMSVPFSQAPDFSVGLFDGSTFHLADSLGSGKPVIVNFWASWCVPCADEAPILQSMAQRSGARLTLVGVDVEDIDSDAQTFLRKYGVMYPNGSGNAGPTSVLYGMRGVPETYFIAPDGHLVRKWAGPLTDAGLDQFVSELLHASGNVAG